MYGGIFIIKKTKKKSQTQKLTHEVLQGLSLFDNINQIAYVSDPYSYEILYVNKYFEKLLQENPVGKKCYEVFQNFKHVCDFCTNKKILKTKGKPYEWEYHNPVLNKDYMITDRIIKWHDGRDVRFEFAIDITELKKIKNQIKNQAKLVDQVSDAIISTDSAFNITSWNKAAQKIYGFTTKEVLGKHMQHLVDVQYVDAKRKEVLNQFIQNGYWKGETIQKRKDGKTINVYSSVNCIKDAKGHIIGAVAVNKDITHIKLYEKKIEDVAKFPVENPFPIMRISKDGVLLFANPSSKQFLKDWKCSVGKKVPQQLKKLITSTYMQDKKNNAEISLHRKTYLYSIVPIKENGYVNLYFSDITSLKQYEQKLGRNEERYRLAQRAAEIGSWDWNVLTDELIWSDEIEPMFGFKKDMFGKTYDAFLECIHPDDRQRVLSAINDCLEKDLDYDIEHRIIWPDGSIHWVKETGGVIRNEEGKAIRMLGIVQDITNHKKIENQIKKLNESLWNYAVRLEAANKEVEAFSYSVSHDLRAPLRSIDGFSQALIEDYADKLDETGLDYLNRVRNASQRMGQLIDSMLQLSRLTRAEMRVEEIDIGKMAVDIINKFRKEDPSRNVDFKLQDNLFSKGDKNLVQILLENLLGNAWKFTSKRRKGKIEIGKKEDTTGTIFFIKDNGIGFDMKYIDKLFVPFQRLHDNDFPGDGIGLGIVSRVIRRHGGRIWAEGEVEKGATFYFIIGGKKYD